MQMGQMKSMPDPKDRHALMIVINWWISITVLALPYRGRSFS